MGKGRVLGWLQLACLVFAIPTLYEIVPGAPSRKHFTVYDEDRVAQGEGLRNYTGPRDVIAAKPDHNSAVTLSGRTLYVGYQGTLASHGIDYQEREAEFNDLDQLRHCRGDNCPTYIFWTDAEKQMWSRSDIGAGFEATPLGYLYRLVPRPTN